MGIEIEKKFLLKNDDWKTLAEGTPYRQGYITSGKERSTVRVRTVGNKKGFLTIKGPTVGATRTEYEYEIPFNDAKHMLDELCEGPIIEKERYKISFDGFIWEVDVFFGENEGLVVAEIELLSEDQHFEKPEWIDVEVTADPRYYNSSLIKKPYSTW